MIDLQNVRFLGATAAVLYCSYKFLSIKVPIGFENKTSFRLINVLFKLISFSARVGNALGIAKEAVIYKRLFDFLTSAKRCEDATIKIEDRKIGNAEIRIYSPKTSDNKLPAVVFYHGGGYVFCTIDTYDVLTFAIAKRLNVIVISVELAPEHPYPIPLNDSWDVTDYILRNLDELNIDSERIAFVGDSAGGALVAMITQRLVRENRKLPKLQLLIYPWMQHFDFLLPSYQHYRKNKEGNSLNKLALWTLGITDNLTKEMEDALAANQHKALLNEELKKEYSNYINPDLIPAVYKQGKSYYDNQRQQEKLNVENNFFKRDANISELVKNLFNCDISPGLVNDEILRKLPKTYMIVCELDELKDEDLIYAERLRRAGIDVQVAYYEDAFHGIIISISKQYYNTIAVRMVDDMINYLQENL